MSGSAPLNFQRAIVEYKTVQNDLFARFIIPGRSALRSNPLNGIAEHLKLIFRAAPFERREAIPKVLL
jgi:hypothetical protein